MIRRFCLLAAIAAAGLGGCAGGGSEQGGNQAGNVAQAAACGDPGRDERVSILGIRPGMRESQARARLECRFPGAGETLAVEADGERPRQTFEILTLSTGPDPILWGMVRRIEYTQESTIPSAASKADVQRRYGALHPVTTLHPVEYDELGLYYAQLEPAAGRVGEADSLPCLAGIDWNNMAKVEVASRLRFTSSRSGPIGLAGCGTMLFVSRGDYENGLTGFVDFILIDFSLLARLMQALDERERREQRERTEQQFQDAARRARNGSGL